ncbi:MULTISPECIES: ankyrin repeat domain-containing protein [Bradyrhizobium]|uniref:ankyrin repeat domain-containing protein n=1 Tax=Bradyrhizobium TaxID=374 RepID=UPI001FCE0165|nr:MULTISPECIES: ankyrin repeat domain-containing protein [Bradyrhizobium]
MAKGAAVDARDNSGDTALICAAREGHMVIIKLIEAAAIRRLNHDSPFHCGGGGISFGFPW